MTRASSAAFRRTRGGACAAGASAKDRDRGCRRGPGRRPAASAADPSTSSSQIRMLSRPSCSTAASSFAMPFTNGSQPMKLISRMGPRLGGEMLAAAEADFQPCLRPGPENRLAGVAPARHPQSAAAASWTSRSWCGRRRLPFRRPKKAPARSDPSLLAHAGSAKGGLERVGEIGPLPGEAAVRVRARGRNGRRPTCGRRSAC